MGYKEIVFNYFVLSRVEQEADQLRCRRINLKDLLLLRLKSLLSCA